MSYDPKWIRDDAVVKRDGTNDLTGDWDIGNQRKLILEELQIRDASGLTIADTTSNILVSVDNQTGLFSLKLGSGINEFSTDTNLTKNSDNVVPTQSAVKSYVDTSISNFSTDKIYSGDSLVQVVDDGSSVSYVEIITDGECTFKATPTLVEVGDTTTGTRLIIDKTNDEISFQSIKPAKLKVSLKKNTYPNY